MQDPVKDPADWTTGDEPMTGPQRSYLQTLCREGKEEFNENWTKAEASKKIDERFLGHASWSYATRRFPAQGDDRAS